MPAVDNSEAYEIVDWILESAESGFYIAAASPPMQRKISERYNSPRVAVYNYQNMPGSYDYYALSEWASSRPEADVLFIMNMQLAFMDDKGFIVDENLLAFNISRDLLVQKRKVWLFFMTREAEVRLSKFAFDAYSYVRQIAYFLDEEDTGPERAQLLEFKNRHNIVKIKEMLDRYKGMEDSCMALSLDETPAGRLLSTAVTLDNIATLYYDGADYENAYKLLHRIRQIREKILSAEHPDTAATYDKIGTVYAVQSDYAKALEWYQKALVILEKIQGVEHPYTAATYDNIGSVYTYQGDYNKALELHQKALVIREIMQIAEHPDTAVTYDNIALVYYEQGDYAKALEWYQKALAIREKILGAGHPDTAATYNNIAFVYYAQGDYAKALEWYQKTLVIKDKILGAEHPDTAITYSNIACVYHAQGDYAKALVLFDKALSVYKKTLGTKHPLILQTYKIIDHVQKLCRQE